MTTLSHRDQIALAAMSFALNDAARQLSLTRQEIRALAFKAAYAFADEVLDRLAAERRDRRPPPPAPPPQRGPGR